MGVCESLRLITVKRQEGRMKTNQYNIHHGFLDDYCGNTGLRKLLAVFKALLLDPVDNDKVKLDNGNRVRGRKFCSTVQ